MLENRKNQARLSIIERMRQGGIPKVTGPFMGEEEVIPQQMSEDSEEGILDLVPGDLLPGKKLKKKVPLVGP